MSLLFICHSVSDRTNLHMSSQILTVFVNYQKSRGLFAQQVADLATRPQNIDFLRENGSLSLLKPLLTDELSGIQQASAMALSRLVGFDESIAKAAVDEGILEILVRTIQTREDTEENLKKGAKKPSYNASRHIKKAFAILLRSIAKHSSKLSRKVIDSGAIKALNSCLQDFDPGVKEAAAWGLGYIASHNDSPDLAQFIIDASAVPLLVTCIQEPELSLKRVAISAVSDIAKHSVAHAQSVVDSNAVHIVSKLMLHADSKIRKQATSLMAQIAKHTVDLAEIVVDSDILGDLMVLLQDDDLSVRKSSATVLRELSKHSIELARIVVNNGGIQALIDLVGILPEKTPQSEPLSGMKLPAVMCLGFIAAFSETFAAAIISSKGIVALKSILSSNSTNYASMNSSSVSNVEPYTQSFIVLQAATAWTLGKIGSHSTEHAFACAENDILRLLFSLYSTDIPTNLTSTVDLAKFTDSSFDENKVEGNETKFEAEVEKPNLPLSVTEIVSDDLKTKAKTALKGILEKTIHLPALQGLLMLENFEKDKRRVNNDSTVLEATPLNIKLIKIVLHQISKVLPNDKSGKKSFVQTGALQFIQELETKLSPDDFASVCEEVKSINRCFPSQIVDYYSPKHAEELIRLIEAEGVIPPKTKEPEEKHEAVSSEPPPTTVDNKKKPLPQKK